MNRRDFFKVALAAPVLGLVEEEVPVKEPGPELTAYWTDSPGGSTDFVNTIYGVYSDGSMHPLT